MMKNAILNNLAKVKFALLVLPFLLLSCHQKNKKGEVGNIPDSIQDGLTQVYANDQPSEDAVLEERVLDLAHQYAELSDFSQAASTIGLEEHLRGKAEQFTIFVPTNEAFRSAGIAVDSTNAEQNLALKEILLYHIVPQHTVSEIWKEELSYTTLNQEDITLTIKDSIAFVNDAKVVVKDIEGHGGVMQVIDKVLVPKRE